MQVEADRRIVAVSERLQRPSFRRLEPQRVAVDVDTLGVAALKPLGAIGIQQRDHVQGEIREDPANRGLFAAAPEILENVEQCRCRRRFVAVHLRPQQHAQRAAAGGDVVNRPSLDGFADFFNLKQAPLCLPRARRRSKRFQAFDEFRVIHQRRQRRGYVLSVPNSCELLRRHRESGAALAAQRRRYGAAHRNSEQRKASRSG